jgi:phosphatidylcholine synthase
VATRARRTAAWGVHLYTALGLPLALAQLAALMHGDAQRFFLLNAAAVFVDATDGAMARAVRVKEVLPEFDGRKLDDIIDFLTFAFLPGVAVVALGLIPPSAAAAVCVPVMASGYGFAQERAKTDDSFVGFPSYWNIVVFYLWVLEARSAVVLVTLLTLSALVFVPFHYVYPTRASLWKPATLALGYLWGGVTMALAAAPHATWSRPVALASLAYPAYYTALSAIHHRRVRRRAPPRTPE